MVPLTQVPFWYRFFEPQPFVPPQIPLGFWLVKLNAIIGAMDSDGFFDATLVPQGHGKLVNQFLQLTLAVAPNYATGVTRVLVYLSIYQGSILDEPHPFAKERFFKQNLRRRCGCSGPCRADAWPRTSSTSTRPWPPARIPEPRGGGVANFFIFWRRGFPVPSLFAVCVCPNMSCSEPMLGPPNRGYRHRLRPIRG